MTSIYVQTPYEESILHSYSKNCNDIDQLKNRLSYSEMAVRSHKRENNPSQVAFFQKDVDFINSKLAKLNKASLKRNIQNHLIA